jgi:hypothetical protein
MPGIADITDTIIETLEYARERKLARAAAHKLVDDVFDAPRSEPTQQEWNRWRHGPRAAPQVVRVGGRS